MTWSEFISYYTAHTAQDTKTYRTKWLTAAVIVLIICVSLQKTEKVKVLKAKRGFDLQGCVFELRQSVDHSLRDKPRPPAPYLTPG